MAEDDAGVREILVEYLVSRGFDVTPAADGLEALHQLKRVRPNVMILDLMMPRLGGIEALVRIRRHFPDVAVVVVTGTPDDALRGRALTLGAAALVSKPLDLDELGAIIATVTPFDVRKAHAPAAPDAIKVLIVDDEAELRDMLGEFVERQRYRVFLAPDGLTALRIVIDEQPEIVLLDIQMPRLGGIEALTAIRAIAPATKVIMISGVESVELAQRALSHGAFDYVRKPVDFAYLQQSLETAARLTE